MTLDDESIRRLAAALADELIARGAVGEVVTPERSASWISQRDAAFRLRKTYDGFRVWARRHGIRSRLDVTAEGRRRMFLVSDVEEAGAALALTSEACSDGVRMCSDDKPTPGDHCDNESTNGAQGRGTF